MILSRWIKWFDRLYVEGSKTFCKWYCFNIYFWRSNFKIVNQDINKYVIIKYVYIANNYKRTLNSWRTKHTCNTYHYKYSVFLYSKVLHSKPRDAIDEIICHQWSNFIYLNGRTWFDTMCELSKVLFLNTNLVILVLIQELSFMCMCCSSIILRMD